MFAKPLHNNNKHPRVLTYINIRLLKLHFSLGKDIFNHRNINFISSFNYSIIYFIINVYSDNQQSTLKNTEINLNNVLIMTRDFNIRDNNWDLLYSHYSIHMDTLRRISDSFNLELSMFID